jgi:hypothetical protein
MLRPARRHCGDNGRDSFDGDKGVQNGILGRVHRGYFTAADLFEELVAKRTFHKFRYPKQLF